MEPFRFHLFVCTQQKPEGVPSCPASGSFAVLDALDRETQARGLSHEVQLTTCGCMGLCDEGPVMVAYPTGVWYRRVRPSDVGEILEAHLDGGKPVERLVWNDAPAMKAMSVEHGEKFRAAMAARDKAGMLPDRFEQMIRGFMSSRCLLTALELDIFTAVGEGANAEEIGTRVHANARAVSMLLNALVALGLLSKSGDDYRNTPESARFFVQGSNDNHRNGLLHTANIWHRWSTLTDAVRMGTRVPMDRDRSPEWTRNFIAGMQRNAKDRAPLVVQALGTAGLHRILDLGGGSGAYSIAFARAVPTLCADILDLAEVVPIAQKHIHEAGLDGRINTRVGDMLSAPLGENYDLILVMAICHMFSPEENRALFQRARKALAPHGRFVIQDFILEPDKTAPRQATLFALNMLVGTRAGATYSEPEYTTWLHAANFTQVRRVRLPGPSSLLIASV